MSNRKKLSDSAGRRRGNQSTAADVTPTDILNIGNEVYDGDDGAAKRRREAAEQIEHAIIPSEDGSLAYRGFKLHSVGLEIPADASKDDFDLIGGFINKTQDAWQFWVGDFAIQTAGKWGATYSYAATLLDVDPKLLENFVWVCNTFDFSSREENLSYTHHRTAASLANLFEKGRAAKASQQAAINALQQAGESGMSTRDFETLVKEQKAILLEKYGTPEDTPKERNGYFTGDEWAYRPIINSAFERTLEKYIKGTLPDDEQAQFLQLVEDYGAWLNDLHKDLKQAKQSS